MDQMNLMVTLIRKFIILLKIKFIEEIFDRIYGLKEGFLAEGLRL
jgi:hypothetical protein